MNRIIFVLLLLVSIVSCKNTSDTLPFIGVKDIVDGKEVEHTIPDWSFTRQDGQIVTNKDLKNHVYVTDFFFLSCPTICPRVMKEMVKLYDAFEDDDRVKFVSFTIDPKRDTPERLQKYAASLGADQQKWWFLNGEKSKTYEIANEYYIVAYEDAEVEGGFDHSGKIVLTDKNGHIRSFSDGTDPKTTDKLIKDIKTLLKSYE